MSCARWAAAMKIETLALPVLIGYRIATCARLTPSGVMDPEKFYQAHQYVEEVRIQLSPMCTVGVHRFASSSVGTR